jgi:pyroglutamyl-peptidase
MKILVTGFKPFLGEKINPSEMLASELEQNFPEVTALVLPVEFGKSFEILKKHLQDHTYDYVIEIGQAAGRSKICFEKIGLNWVQTEHKDESGSQPQSGSIVEGPLALMTTFPVDTVYQKLKAEQFPVEISFSAGAFVCNDLYFRTLNEFKNLKTVFVHVPLIEVQAMESKKPFLSYSESLLCFSELITILKES